MNESKELVSFLELSEEMALHIFKYCTLQTKYFLTSTSKFCRRVVCDDELKLVCLINSISLLKSPTQELERWIVRLGHYCDWETRLQKVFHLYFWNHFYLYSGLFILRKIIHIFPTCPDVWKEVGLCYKQMDDFENAIEALFIALDVCVFAWC